MNITCGVQSLCVFAVLSACVVCVQCGQCVCGQYVECVFAGCVGRKECVECVECVCVFGVHVCFRLAHDGSFTQARAGSSVPNLIMEMSAQEQGA